MRYSVLGALLLFGCKGGDDDMLMPMYELPHLFAKDSTLCLSYQPTTLGETRTFSTTLKNEGRQTLVISSGSIIEDKRGFFSVTGTVATELTTFQSARVQLKYEPTAEGWDTAVLEIQSNAENSPVHRIFLLGLGRPVGVDITWDPGPKPDEAFPNGEEACK